MGRGEDKLAGHVVVKGTGDVGVGKALGERARTGGKEEELAVEADEMDAGAAEPEADVGPAGGREEVVDGGGAGEGVELATVDLRLQI